MSRNGVLAMVTGAVLVALFAGGFFANFERVEEEVEVGFQGAARSNPYLAAERLFTRLGAPSRTLAAGPSTLPPSDHALLLVSPLRSIPAEQVEQIVAWVQEGGRLLVAVDEAPSLDPLLRHWRVRVTETPEAGGPEILQVPLSGGKTARAEMSQDRRLETTRNAPVQFGSDAGLALVRYAEGEGSVTFLSDASFFANENIGLHDHATLAWALVRAGGEPPAGVWLAVRDHVPQLSELLARHAWMALASGAVLITAWLWAAGSRFGPLLPEPPHGRRSLLEHIEASGEFLWRIGRAADLIRDARQALLRRIEVREPAWARLPPHELVQRLAASSRLPAPRVDRALHGEVTAQDDLVTALQTLETLRRTL